MQRRPPYRTTLGTPIMERSQHRRADRKAYALSRVYNRATRVYLKEGNAWMMTMVHGHFSEP